MSINLQTRIAASAPPEPPPPEPPPEVAAGSPVLIYSRAQRTTTGDVIYSNVIGSGGPEAGDWVIVTLMSRASDRGTAPTAPDWIAVDAGTLELDTDWTGPYASARDTGDHVDRVDVSQWFRQLSGPNDGDNWELAFKHQDAVDVDYDAIVVATVYRGGTPLDSPVMVFADGADTAPITANPVVPAACPDTRTVLGTSAIGVAVFDNEGNDNATTPNPAWTNAEVPAGYSEVAFAEASFGTRGPSFHNLAGMTAQGYYQPEADVTVDVTWGAYDTYYDMQVLLWLSYTPATAVAAASGGSRQAHRGLPEVHWTLEGKPVDMDGWAPGCGPGGFDQMRGTLPQSQLRRIPYAGQGATVRAEDAEGNVVWEGRLSAAPYLKDGLARLAAQGEQYAAAKKTDRLFIQSRDMDIWTPTDSEPHLGASGNPIYDHYRHIDVGGTGRLVFTVDKDQALSAGFANGHIFYAEGVDLTRVAFFMNYDASDETSNLLIRLQRADGPDGAETNVNTWATTNGNNGVEKDHTTGATNDLFVLELKVDTGFTPSSKGVYRLSKVRVNSDICTTDTFYAWQIADYAGTQLGWDTSGVVATSSLNALPFDWQEDWSGALDYLDDIEDTFWRVVENRNNLGPLMERDVWGATNWKVYLAEGADPDLTPLELFDEVIVHFTSPRGIERRAVATSTTVSVGNTLEFELNDRQADSTFASAVAAKLLARYSTQRYAGTIEVVAAHDPTGIDAPYGIRYGDTVTVADWDAGKAQVLRAMDVEYRPDGVRVGVEQPINIGSLLNGRWVTKKKRRPHR